MSSEWLLKIIPKGWAWLKNLHERRKQRITQKHFELNNQWLGDAKTKKTLKSILEYSEKPIAKPNITVTYNEKFLCIRNKEPKKLNINKVEFEAKFAKAVKEKVDFDFETFQTRVETSRLSLEPNDSFCFYYDPEKKSMTNINDRVEQCGRPFNLKCYFADSELSDVYPVKFLPISKPPLEPSPTPKLVSEANPLPVPDVKTPMCFTYTDGAFYVERTVDKPVEILDITFNSDFVKEIKRIVEFNFEAFQGIVEGRFFSLASDCHCHCFHFTPLFEGDVYTTNMRECALLTKSDFRLKVVYVLALDKTNRRTEEFTARFSDIEIYKQYSFSDVRHHLPADPNYVPF
ncbi:MAG: hypothetical protein IJ793_04475 [Opitutales bacterium]|nr:hypothetical protein [Opitutales bacterium]